MATNLKVTQSVNRVNLKVTQNGNFIKLTPTVVVKNGGGGGGGADGLSAYQIAVNNGFIGTEAEWLDSLNGTDGVDGINGTNGTNGSNGVNGSDGANGLSAYEVAVADGYVGDETSWLASLVGADGADGTDGADADNLVLTNNQIGTTYTLVLSDANKLIRCNNASAITVTIPTNASVAFPIGTVITISQAGVGTVTVGGAGVTINAFQGTKTQGQFAAVQIIKTATDTWTLFGGKA